MHQELRKLAYESSSEKRLELLRKLSDMFFTQGESHSDAEQYLFGEIVDMIVDVIDKPQKVVVAKSIAIQSNFPHAAAVKLAADADIDVARPVITQSAVLTAEDLARLAGKGSQDHLCAIAARPDLPEIVTDVLVDRGDVRVVHTVSANTDARFSESGMDGLVAKAREDVDLRELLVERPDLSATAVAKLLPLVSANLVVKLIERGYDIGDSLPPEMLELVNDRLAGALRQRKNNIRDTSSLVEAVHSGELTLDEAACVLTHGGRLLDLAALLSTFANVDRDYLFTLLSRGQLQAVMILFRALGLAWTTLERALALREQKGAHPVVIRADNRADYESISPAVARRTLRFSHVRRTAVT